MTRREVNILMALGVTVIVSQILCTAVLLQGQTRTQRSYMTLQRELSGADDASPSRSGGAVLTPGEAVPPPSPQPSTQAAIPLRIVFPEEDIRNARQRVDAAKSELRKAQTELDQLVHGDR